MAWLWAQKKARPVFAHCLLSLLPMLIKALPARHFTARCPQVTLSLPMPGPGCWLPATREAEELASLALAVGLDAGALEAHLVVMGGNWVAAAEALRAPGLGGNNAGGSGFAGSASCSAVPEVSRAGCLVLGAMIACVAVQQQKRLGCLVYGQATCCPVLQGHQKSQRAACLATGLPPHLPVVWRVLPPNPTHLHPPPTPILAGPGEPATLRARHAQRGGAGRRHPTLGHRCQLQPVS